MIDDELLKRIEALNKKPLQNKPELDTSNNKKIIDVQSRIHSFDIKPASEISLKKKTKIAVEPLLNLQSPPALNEIVNGLVIDLQDGLKCYLVEKSVEEIIDDHEVVHQKFLDLLGIFDNKPSERINDVCNGQIPEPGRILFMDIETTGLSENPLFLIGIMECSMNGFVFKQYFARNYAEEAGVLVAYANRLNLADFLITFNGKFFDVPYIEKRAAYYGLEMPKVNVHLDILHESRRIIGNKTPNHRLQTLEQLICKRYREDDIPGRAIPAAYWNYLKTGNAGRINQILKHNLLDLFTMADLMGHIYK